MCVSLGAVLISSSAAEEPNAAQTPTTPATLAQLRPQLHAALERTLPLLQNSAAVYVGERDCFTCHHQALPAMVVSLAAAKGHAVDAKLAQEQAEFTHAYFEPRREKLAQGTGLIGGPYTAGYALAGFKAAAWPADETTAALVQYLLAAQEGNGRWRMRTQRPPLEASDFTATALAVQGLTNFSPLNQPITGPASDSETENATENENSHAKASDPTPAPTAAAIQKALAWLLAAQPATNEDRAFHLLGLKWAGAEESAIQKARRQLLSRQLPDGGWEQEPGLGSDAYATGQALVALHQGGGLKTSHAAYRRGLAYLLGARQPDGSWKVTTRAKPIQVYFESGFPHEKSQFISICGTCWAAMAMLHAE